VGIKKIGRLLIVRTRFTGFAGLTGLAGMNNDRPVKHPVHPGNPVNLVHKFKPVEIEIINRFRSGYFVIFPILSFRASARNPDIDARENYFL